MRNRYFHIISLLFVLSIWVSAAYSQKTYDPDLTRILFVLDASGSMNEDWGERSKYESAKKLLFSVADSLTANNRKVQFGLRMFGHQKPKAEYDCKDSKLEVPFSANNSFRFTNALNEATPQGWTPIAYSLFLAANDFPADNRSTNAIVLITDGLETCEGDPCASALILQKKRIAIKPFIIGLGIGEDGRKAFDCVGTYYDASDENSFKHIINVVVSQALNTTTAQVNLLNAYGKPTETNVEMTFNDSHSGAILYNFVHTMDATGVPDTLFLDPVGKYDLTIHSIPPVTKTGIELIPGKHNIIAMDVPMGELTLEVDMMLTSNLRCVLRQENSSDIVHVQDVATSQKYIIGRYDLEILTLPPIYRNGVSIEQSKTKEISIPKAGRLNLICSINAIASIYSIRKGRLVRVYEFKETGTKQTLVLQPGNYQLIYRGVKVSRAIRTGKKDFKIISNEVTRVQF